MKNGKPNVKLTLIENKDAEIKNARLLSEEAKGRIIVSSRGKARKLARSILRRWNARLDLNEVDSIVDLSLCEAAARFSPDMGASFMTFLFYHLRGNLIRTISTAANTNSVPLLDGEYSGDEDFIGGSVQSYEIANAITGSEVAKPDEILIKQEMLSLSISARDKLDTLAKQVLERVFVDEEQLIDIAYDLGYSRCHISRVKRRALEHMYDHLSPDLALDANKKPHFDEDEDHPRGGGSSRSSTAKTRTSTGRAKPKKDIHRRKPRSQAFIARKVVNG